MTNKQAQITINAIKFLLDNAQYSEDVEEALNMAISALAEQRWIPCSERLPEERQEILATTTDNAWGDVVIIRTYYKEMHKSVIAWMPLPEPYREGDC